MGILKSGADRVHLFRDIDFLRKIWVKTNFSAESLCHHPNYVKFSPEVDIMLTIEKI